MPDRLLPDAARALCGSPASFTEGCRADMAEARAEADRARRLGPSGGLATVEAFDAAFAALSGAASRCQPGPQRPPRPGAARDGRGGGAGGGRPLHRAVARPRSLRRAGRAWTSPAWTRPPATWWRRACATSGAPAWTGTSRRAGGSGSCATSWSASARSSAATSRTTCAACPSTPVDLERPARGLAPRPPARPGRQGGGHDRQRRLRPLPDLRPERAGARGALAALPAARPPGQPGGAGAAALAPGGAGPAPRLPELGGLRHRGQDDRQRGGRGRVRRAHLGRRRGAHASATTPSSWSGSGWTPRG